MTITFSRHKLTAFLACHRRFQLRYLRELPWPVAPPDSAWQEATQRGERFHRLLERHFLGLAAPETVEDDQVKQWRQIFLEKGPTLPAGERLPEMTLTVPVGQHLLTGRFDLLLLSEAGVHIYDWKTETRPRDEAELSQDWQTKLYLALVVAGGEALRPGRGAVDPAQVSLTYWFTAAPDRPVTITYSQAEHERNWANIVALIEQIEANLVDESPWPLTDNWATCGRCAYQVYCGRQSAPAGPSLEWETEEAEEELMAATLY